MPLREIDRQLLDRCLSHEPKAWNDFVDRYMGLIYHVIHHVAHARKPMPLSEADVEDVAADIFPSPSSTTITRFSATSRGTARCPPT